ncbi:winged helix-turn-helix domain-containing protein [Halomicrococcus gelatinilyticus]|uniref:winged helix-turn-helix domain-containing protein n=1 Tax=Halomicrococcus gelatinilyticus TaxID=1702103 RepID=UPI002E10A557
MTVDDHDSTGDDAAGDGSLTTEETFALVGDEVRAEILRALSAERGGEGELPSLSFSELRERVDADVRSSQFNYHLQRLVDHFVENRAEGTAQLIEDVVPSDDDGYALRPEGTTLTRTIRARTGTGEGSLDPVAVGLDCYHCGTAVEATYDNATFVLQCPDCEYLYEYDLVPPGILDGEAETLSRAAEYVRHVRLAFARGVCPLCGNAVDTSFDPPGETGYPRPDLRAVCVNRSCDHCGHRNYLKVGEALLRDPDLVSFCRERGLDVTSTPIWELAFAATDRDVDVRSTDPWEVALEVELDGETLELVVDGNLAVVERNYA